MNSIAKAAALSAAWVDCTGQNPPSRNAVLWPLAQADLESMDGDAWGGDKGPHDWGCTDYRAPTAAEEAEIAAGTLKTGYWLHANGSAGADRQPTDVAQLHLDSHPGGTWYAMWFAAFPDDEHGAAYFLKIVLRMVGGCLADRASTIEDYAELLYEHGYYEGTTRGARPVGHRTLPFTAPEVANVEKYVAGMNRCIATLGPALAGWAVPGGATGDVNVETADAQESGPDPAGGPETNDGNGPNTIPVPSTAHADTLPPGPDDTHQP